MAEETPRKKQPDKDKVAADELRDLALEMAKDAGIEVNKDWTAEQIQSAINKAEKAAKDAEKAAADEAAKPKAAKPAEPEPTEEEAAMRAEIMAEAHKAGMDLDELKGKPVDEVLNLIGKHIGEQATRKDAEANVAPGKINVRVLKAGDNKISKGIHVPGVGDLRYKHNDTLKVTRQAFAVLEGKGFVEEVSA
jgi:hypothetical protein